MADKPRVLVASPAYDGMKYCIDEFLERMKELSYDNYEILIVDNSEGTGFFEELTKVEGIRVIRDETGEKNNMERVVSSRNKIIEYALAESYDYILMMDCDVIPPKNIIEELSGCEKEIVSGVYMNYFMSSGEMKVLPVAWMEIEEEEFEKMKGQLPDGMKRSDFRRHITQKEYESGKLFRVIIPSAGCVLLSKNVFEKIRYGLIDMKAVYGNSKLKTSDDIYFFNEAKKKGFESYCYTKIKCDHLLSGKYERDSKGNVVHKAFK